MIAYNALSFTIHTLTQKQMNQNFSDQWQKLKRLANDESIKDLQGLFSNDTNRVKMFSHEYKDIYVDFSKNWINQDVLNHLLALAKHANLDKKIQALFSGAKINVSENKPATHTAQRKIPLSESMQHDRDKMFEVAKNYASGKWKSAFNNKIKTVVNIGIGGSYLGPKVAIQALTDLQINSHVQVLYFASVDDVRLLSILKSIDIKSTLFCLSSKSLGTIETLKNTESLLTVLNGTKGYNPKGTNHSFVAATANCEKAISLGIPESHIMPFDTATGGRFSVWSAIGFPLLMAIGEVRFLEFLSGAETMDQHFEKTGFDKNIPILMAMVSIWYRNFMHLSAYAVIPYDANLKHLPAWLQQLMMESNGKMHDVNGEQLTISTSPWLFGDHGQLSQHAFFQAFHQGKDVLPIDFIGVIGEHTDAKNYLLINMMSQAAALMNGSDDTHDEFNCPGNRPSTTLLLNKLTASSLGQLLALYEHMIFVQSVIWNINCFDQPGVELGKKIAREIVEHIQDDTLKDVRLDPSTQQLLERALKHD